MNQIHWAVILLALIAVGCTFAFATPKEVAAPTPPAAQSRYSLGTSATWRGLTVWPVLDSKTQKRPVGQYKTLVEALADGTLKIAEMDSSGSVPQLQVHNTGSTPVLLTAGEVLQGGKQDRVLVQDVLVPVSPQPTPVAVNCVEQGRWSPGKTGLAFSYGGKSEVALTRAVQTEKSQSATWSTVAELNSAKRKAVAPSAQRELAPTTGTYMASLAQSEVTAQVDLGLRQLQPVFLDADPIVGLVTAVGGKIESAEIYGHPALFAKNQEQVLRGAVLQVVSQNLQGDTSKPPGDDEALAFLQQALAAKPQTVEASPDGTVVRKEAKAARASAYTTEDAKGELLHMNVYADK
jgi:hypothetical protein